jgi:hypothetical protein
MRRPRWRPQFDLLESRALLSAAVPLHYYAADFIGPPQPGWLPVADDSAPSAAKTMPLTMTINPAAPALGSSFVCTLTNPNGSGPFVAISTSWTVTVSYKGDTTPPTVVVGAIWNASVIASIPGDYAIEATTTWMSSNFTIAPPAPTVTNGQVTIPPPSRISKDVNDWSGSTTAPPLSAITVLDQIFAGDQPLGGSFAGWIEEYIPAYTFYDGSIGSGTGGWWASGSYSFMRSGSYLYDQQMFSGSTAPPTPTFWPAIPVGQVICTWTQEFQAHWWMPVAATATTPAGNAFETATINSLSWTWSKVDANNWTTN